MSRQIASNDTTLASAIWHFATTKGGIMFRSSSVVNGKIEEFFSFACTAAN
jgi:hypothetical protein